MDLNPNQGLLSALPSYRGGKIQYNTRTKPPLNQGFVLKPQEAVQNNSRNIERKTFLHPGYSLIE